MSRFIIIRSDKYQAAVFYVYSYTGLIRYLANGSAARTDYISNFIRIYF